MTPEKDWSWLAAAGRILLGCVFIFSGFQKAIAPAEEFAVIIDAYYLLPKDMLLPMATFMPWMELIFGVFLVTGYLTRLSAALCGAMLSAFLFALLSAKLRGIPLENCGCFGAAVHVKTIHALALDTTLLALSFLSFKQGRRRYSLDNWVDAGT